MRIPAYPEDIDYQQSGFGDIFDELPLWSAPFGLMLLEQVPLRRSMKVLDVGAGTGFLTVELAQRCGAGSEVIAVDPWAAAMERLRFKVERLGLDNVTLLECAIEDAPIARGSVDLAVSNLGVNNFERAEKALVACRAALSGDGRLVLTTNLRGHMQEVYDEFSQTLEELGLDSCLSTLDEHVAHRATIESATQLLTASGFEAPEVTLDSFVMRFADGSSMLRHFLIRLGFLREWKAIVPASEADRVIERLQSRLDERAARLGGLTLTIPMACFDTAPAAMVSGLR